MRPVVFNPAYDTVLDVDDPVRAVGHTTFVGHDDDCRSVLLVESGKKFHDFYGGLGIKSSCRFVCKNDLRICDEGSGDCHSLLLSSREFIRIVFRPLCEAQFFKKFKGHLPSLFATYTLIEQRKFDIFHCCLEGNQIE